MKTVRIISIQITVLTMTGIHLIKIPYNFKMYRLPNRNTAKTVNSSMTCDLCTRVASINFKFSNILKLKQYNSK